jgi:hypothetical protein
MTYYLFKSLGSVPSATYVPTRNTRVQKHWGGAAHPTWNLVYPYHTQERRPKVMTYTRNFSVQHSKQRNALRTIPRLDLATHPTILITDHYAGPDQLRIINFYNDVDNPTSLATLLSLELDSTVPTILLGDFNLHSPSWSPPDLQHSPRAADFERWAANQTFTLATGLGDITRRGCKGDRPSTLDLTWHNLAADLSTPLTPPIIDWAASLGSDHVGIRTTWLPESGAPSTKVKPLRTFKTEMDTDNSARWHERVRTTLPPITPLTTPTLIDTNAAAIQAAIHGACEEFMKHKRTPGARSRQWWNEECTDATAALQRAAEAHADEEERKRARKRLKAVTRDAKRKWADKIVTEGNVWDVAKWRHGRKTTSIAALKRPDGQLTFDHTEMTDILSRRFFSADTGRIATNHEDDPPPRPERTFEPFSNEELEELLKGAGNTAPGKSGISWTIVRKAWPLAQDHITHLANACLTLGYHPKAWRRALVVVIPKPNRDDMTAAKNFRPISLLETVRS